VSPLVPIMPPIGANPGGRTERVVGAGPEWSALSAGLIEPALNAILPAIVRRGDSIHTRRAYAGDLGTFARWLAKQDLSWDGVMADDLDRYREWLATSYARTTANRRLTVVRGLYAEAVRRRLMGDNPADRVRGIRGRDEREGGALSRDEAREVFAETERDLVSLPVRLIALRDLAILAILIRTGIRRFEVVSLRVGDLGTSQGHNVVTLRAGKGNVTRTIKLPPDVRRTLDAWLDAAAEAGAMCESGDPLFVQVRKGGHLATTQPLSDRAIHSIVTRRLRAAGVSKLGPHSLRATFVTLALEGGAPLHIVQRAAGHADPRTTERYWRRKDNLDDNAVDYVRL
jgi:integrase/recombinase XerD